MYHSSELGIILIALLCFYLLSWIIGSRVRRCVGICVVEMHGLFFSCARKLRAWSFNAHRYYHGADEFITPLEAEKFVLLIKFKGDIMSNGVNFKMIMSSVKIFFCYSQLSGPTN